MIQWHLAFHQRMEKKMPRRQRRTPDQWRALIKEYSQSGRTVDQFCDQANISPSSLYKWMSRLRPSDQASDFVHIQTSAKAQKASPHSTPQAEFTYISPNGGPAANRAYVKFYITPFMLSPGLC